LTERSFARPLPPGVTSSSGIPLGGYFGVCFILAID
jgi:hypothetical protein